MGLTGPNFMAMSKIGEKYVLEKILPGSDPKKRFFTWQENIKFIKQVSFVYLRNQLTPKKFTFAVLSNKIYSQFYDAAEEAYLKHNEHVKVKLFD